MGVLLSICQGNGRPTKEELENKIQVLLEETKKLKTENDLIREENEKTNEDLTVASRILIGINEKYKNTSVP